MKTGMEQLETLDEYRERYTIDGVNTLGPSKYYDRDAVCEIVNAQDAALEAARVMIAAKDSEIAMLRAEGCDGCAFLPENRAKPTAPTLNVTARNRRS
jgi:hypothetical protein